MTLSASEARRLAIGGAALALPRPRKARAPHVLDVLETLGALQLDTISTLARAHELVPMARLGAVSRDDIDAALWGPAGDPAHPGPVSTVEYWSHAACVLPVDLWPLYAFRRRWYHRRGYRWHSLSDKSVNLIRRQLRDGGPVTTGDLGGAKSSSAWWDWSESKIAIEWLLDVGEVVCVRRVGWRRVYDLAERALPTDVQRPTADWVHADGVYGLSDDACHDALVERAVLLLGVGTMADIADVHRLYKNATKHAIDRLVEQGRIVEVQVQGWKQPAYMHAAPRSAATRRRPVLLSPFDPLVWERDRLERMFGVFYRIEAYTPAAKRERGYYAMPVLAGDRIIGTVDPARTHKGKTLVARTVVLDSARESTHRADASAVAAALREAASWVGAEQITVGTVRPAAAEKLVRQAVETARD